VAQFYNENSGLKIDYALWKKSLRNSDISNKKEKVNDRNIFILNQSRHQEKLISIKYEKIFFIKKELYKDFDGSD
jgi:hypothetical protein